MCGIVSIFSYHYAAPAVEQEELLAIRDHMINRGPDGKGEWYSSDRRVGFGHRRLSIIDLSDAAAQPMVDSESGCVISFNGEIYNYKALRKELTHHGYKFRTQSDTEVLLHLYAEKGEDMVHDLRGMFAFTIWDEAKRALFLARDPYGIKPLYYADDGWTIRVASQVKAILAGGKVSDDPEPAGITGFYLLGSVPEPWTTHQAIRAVPAGCMMWVTNTGCAKPRQYFSVASAWKAAQKITVSKTGRQEKVRDALLDSVKHHMVADVPVGVFLSAGIDSGVLTALMTELSAENRKLKTITLAFEEFKGTQNDESLLAEQLAEHYGAEHTTRYVSEQEFHEDLPIILEAMDQPTIDGINTWFVAKAAKEQGLKVVVSGLGGDELFGGYPSFWDIPRWVKYMALPSRIPLLGKIVRGIARVVLSHTLINPKAAGMLEYGGKWHTAWLLKRGLFMPWELGQVMDAGMAKRGLQRLNVEHHIRSAINPLPDTAHGKVAAMEASLYMRNQLLRDADWAGMAHSLEVRVPLVDSVLLTSIVGILKSGDNPAKQLLAMSTEKPLPSIIVSREKTSFTTPIDQWQKHSQGRLQREDLSTQATKNTPWARRWAFTVIAT